MDHGEIDSENGEPELSFESLAVAVEKILMNTTKSTSNLNGNQVEHVIQILECPVWKNAELFLP